MGKAKPPTDTERMLAKLTGKSIRSVRARAQREFQPCCAYYPALDFLLYLTEDCAYVAGKFIPKTHVELLMHPHEDRVVGIKIHGFSALASGSMRRTILNQFRKGDKNRSLPTIIKP